jgi:hypothetical protein
VEQGSLDWRLPMPSASQLYRRHALNLLVETEEKIIHASIALPRMLSRTRLESAMDARNTVKAGVRVECNKLHVNLSSTQPIRKAFAKIERLGPRILIFDDHGWYGQGG